MNQWTSIILAGGHSTRMGTSKALLDIKGQPLIEKITEVVRPYSQQVIIVSNEQDSPEIEELFAKVDNVKILLDDAQFRGHGPLAGMLTGMQCVSSKWYYVSACDLPNIEDNYVRCLHDLVYSESGHDAFIPVHDNRYQPFAAVYAQKASVIYDLLAQGKKRWYDLLEMLHRPYMIEEKMWLHWTEARDSLWSMNNRQDYDDFIDK